MTRFAKIRSKMFWEIGLSLVEMRNSTNLKICDIRQLKIKV